MMRRLNAFFAMATLSMFLLSTLPAKAQQTDLEPGFDPNRILEDEDMFNVNGMTYDRIVQFLRSRGTLARYRTPDIDGVPKTVPEILWRVATSYKMNPKYLLALIQKEQSLVEDPNPTPAQFDWAAGFAICDSCSKNDPALQEFKGFASQLEWAAKQHREKYLQQLLANGQTRGGKAPGKTVVVDGETITPANNATAMLYSYTPHLHGNLNLWNIWRRWFSLKYPDGTVIRAKGSGTAYLIRFGQKRPFGSRAVMQSLVDPNRVLDVSDIELAAYPEGAPIRFPKYALLREPNGRIWLLTDGGRRHIQDMKAFRKFSFNEDELEDIESAELADYPVLDPITVKTEFPQGVVLQDRDAKTTWYVENGTRRLVADKVLLALYFKGRKIKPVSKTTLAKYDIGDPYRLHDGELVRGKKASSVYVVENGALRPIRDAETFESFGWSWKNVVTVSDSTLNDYTVGDPV